MSEVKNRALYHFYNAMRENELSKKNGVSASVFVKKSLGRESLTDSDKTIYESEAKTVDNNLDKAFKYATEALAKENLSVKFNNNQKKIAKMALAMALDPENAMNAVGSVKPEGIEVSTVNYNTQSMGLESLRSMLPDSKDISLATEKFGSQELNNMVVNTVSLAVSAAAQDSFMELVFPMVIVDPKQSHIVTKVTYSEFGKGYKRFSGNISKPQQYEMVLNMYKKELYNSDYLKLMPVLGVKANGEDDSDKMLEKAVFQVNYRDVENCNVAPLRLGKKIDIIGVSQTAADLANGVRNDTDILDKSIKLNSIFLEAMVDGAEKYIKLDTTNIRGIAFNPRNDGNGDMTTVSFVHNFKLNTKTAADFRPDQVDATKGKMFGDGAKELILGFDLIMDIAISLADGYVTRSQGSVMLTTVKDLTDGKEYTNSNDPVFKEGEQLLAKIKPAGYLLDATITNTNFKDKGIQGRVRSDQYVLNVGLKSSIGLTGEVDFAKKEGNQSDYDLFTIEEQTVYIDQQMGGNAVTVLFNYIDNLRSHKESGTLDQVTTQTPTHHYIRPYLEEVDLDLLSVVDSLKSTERMADIRQAILNKIRFQAIMMDRTCNYRDAVKYRFKTTKRTLVVMTDTEIASILTCNDGASSVNNRIPLTDNIDLIVAESYYPEFANKMIISYVTPEDNDNGGVPLLNVGATLYSPMLNYEVAQKERDGGIVKELHNVLRFEHIINLPIFLVYNVSNVDRVIEKLALHTIAK